MNELKLKLYDNTDIIIPTPILFGFDGMNLKSKIKDYCQSTGTGRIINTKEPLAKEFIKMQIALSNTKDEKTKKEIEKEIENFAYNNPELLVLFSDSTGDLNIMLDIIKLIEKIYNLSGLSDKFDENVFKEILIYFLKEAKNNLENFLGYIQEVK